LACVVRKNSSNKIGEHNSSNLSHLNILALSKQNLKELDVEEQELLEALNQRQTLFYTMSYHYFKIIFSLGNFNSYPLAFNSDVFNFF
jgi:hypothetical protein